MGRAGDGPPPSFDTLRRYAATPRNVRLRVVRARRVLVRGTPDRGGRQSGSPSGFPKVDTGTQKGRDDLRRKVLTEELATEEKLLAEARATYGSGAPPPTLEEQTVPQRYAERVAKLRQAVVLHEKNIEALKKELAATR